MHLAVACDGYGEIVYLIASVSESFLSYSLSPICTPWPLETLLFLLFACGISSDSVFEHFKIAFGKMAPVVLMLKERSRTWYVDQQYVAGSHNLEWKSRSAV